jgi:hypothetical protein
LKVKVVIWRCTDECGEYYASTNAGDLAGRMNHKSSMSNSVGQTGFTPTFTRDTCPSCKQPREPITVEIPGVVRAEEPVAEAA